MGPMSLGTLVTRFLVILSGAKDLLVPEALQQILRLAQDDKKTSNQ